MVAFDEVAASYDTHFAAAPAARLFRFRVMERLLPRLGSRRTILDLGCGTGEDAIWLAGLGYDVTGVDASARMIEVARKKAASLGSRARFTHATFQETADGGARADAVFSNFGALNCVETTRWTAALPGLLNPGGIGHVVVMGPSPLPETLRLGRRASDRRLTGSAAVGGSTISVTYDRAFQVCRALEPAVRVTGVEALGCVVPGPGFAGFAARHPIAMAGAASIESVVRAWPFFRDRGDHVLIEFEAR